MAKVLKSEQIPASILLKETDNGQLRMLAVYSNNFEDRSKEIFPEDSHRKYAEWANTVGFKPVITYLHHPRMPEGFWVNLFTQFKDNVPFLNEVVKAVYSEFGLAQVEKVLMVNGFPVFDCVVFEDKKEIVKRLSENQNLAMSHGFVLFKRDGNILLDYITFEGTILERHRADNMATMPLIVSKEYNMAKINKQDQAHLEEVYGEDTANMLVRTVDKIKNVLESAGTNFKEVDAEADTELEDVKEGEVEPSDVEEKETDADSESTSLEEEKAVDESDGEEEDDEEEDVKEVDLIAGMSLKEISEALKLDQLAEVLTTQAEKIATLEADKAVRDERDQQIVAELEKIAELAQRANMSVDEKVAEQFDPVPDWRTVGHVASRSKENIVNEEESTELKKDAPLGNNAPQDDTELFLSALGIGK